MNSTNCVTIQLFHKMFKSSEKIDFIVNLFDQKQFNR